MWFQMVRYDPNQVLPTTEMLGLTRVLRDEDIEIWIQAYIGNPGQLYDLSKYDVVPLIRTDADLAYKGELFHVGTNCKTLNIDDLVRDVPIVGVQTSGDFRLVSPYFSTCMVRNNIGYLTSDH